jgi:photosystem II stability/assembly factor-like uncharacterized protein
VAGVPGDPGIYYAATAGGGVWKSEDGGISFKPVFDDQPASSIGSIAVAASDPTVVYVGTGEANIRGNVAAGNGIYKSTDAGKTWKHIWNQVGHIGTMIVHPQNSDIAFAAVLGHAFGPNQERGVYRTTNGGKTWERVLFKDVDTGASDVCFDPNNPRILFAGLWQTRRKPWDFTSGGPGSGLYASHDGGDNWVKLEPGKSGLPDGPYGKIGVAVAPSDSKRVYAIIEAQKGGLFRSEDGGQSWTLATADRALRQRAWYYSTLTVDPGNPDIVWAPQVPLLKSIDGGRTFRTVKGPHHGDHHDIWIDPKNPKRMIDANDGGVDISTNGGKSWTAPPLPISQFYHVNCDNSMPYRVMGNMQDLGAASGPSNSLNSAGILLSDWHPVGGGETGFSVPDPSNPNIVYSGEYGGHITRYDHRTRQSRTISIYPVDASGHGAEDLKYRFQWTAPILVSRHDPKVVYHAGNVVFRTSNGGQTWDKISGDLTRDDKNKQRWSGGPITGDNTGVEVYCTVFALAESPLDAKVLWAGSDDGLVHVSRNGGIRWDNVTANVPDFPDWATVVCIEASPFHAGTAYLVADAHKLDDLHPYLWKTNDYGQTWKKITDSLASDVYAHALREDPKRKGLLYLGTERGVMFSSDDGDTWQPLQLNLPTVPVHDLVVKDRDLVVGTLGRSIWILDDVTALREWKPNVAQKTSHLFSIQSAVRWRYHGNVSDHQVRGTADNPPKGALIQYFLKEKPKKSLTIEILNSEGKRVIFIDGKEGKPEPDPEADDSPDGAELEPRKPEIMAEPGINRFVWDLTHQGADIIPKAKIDGGDPTVGPLVSPGTYKVVLKVDGKSLTATIDVEMDPRVLEPVGVPAVKKGIETLEIAPREADPKAKADPESKAWMTRRPMLGLIVAEAKEQEKVALRIRDDISKVSAMVAQVRSIRKQVDLQMELLAAEPKAKGLQKLGRELAERVNGLEASLHNPKAQVAYDILAQKGGAKLYSQFSTLLEAVRSADGPVTQGVSDMLADLERELSVYVGQMENLKSDELAKYNDAARKIQVPLIWIPSEKKK